MRRRTSRATSSLVGLDDAASSLSRYTNASTHMSHARANTIDASEYRPAKQRKVAGLNTRFDRMIKSVNTTLSYRTSNPASSRKRMQSSGTSSVSSHDVPKTPVDAFSSLHPGKLGNDFSVLKMKKSLPLLRNDADGFSKPVAPRKEPKSPLPNWLANTFCNLEAGHPLRVLLSPSRINTESKPNSPSVELPGASREEEVFAFSPFDEGEDAAHRTDNTLNVQGHISSVIPQEHTLSRLQLEASTNPLPFSTPGRFAPVRRSTGSSIIDSTFQKPLVPVPPQVTSHTTNTMHPPALPASHLRPDDAIGRPQFTQGFSNFVQGTGSPSDLQEHDTNTNRCYQVSPGGCDNLNVYVTPGPTFACSRPIYFDSPTEDPSLSDPLQLDPYELDLNAIDFRWRPFLRSNTLESDMNRRPVSPSSPLGYAVPNQVTAGDQSGWNVRFAADKGEYGASSRDLPSLAEDMDLAYLDDAGAIPPSNVDTTITKLGTISNVSNTIGSWSSPINDVQDVATFICPGVFLSPLRDQPGPALLAAGRVLPRGDGENIHTSEGLALPHGEEMRATGSKVHGIRPSTPIRRVPVSPPSTPQKLRSSQLCEMPRAPVRKTSSALSWMIPLKPSKKRTIAVRDDVDSIESWSE